MPLRAISTARETTDDVTLMRSGQVGERGPTANAAPIAALNGAIRRYPHNKPMITIAIPRSRAKSRNCQRE